MRTLQVLGIITLLGIVTGSAALAYAYNSVDVDALKPQDLVAAQTTSVTWADGSAMGEWAAQDRTIVTGDQIPEHVKNAFIAAEDRSFYDNRGFSVIGIGRAVLGQLTGNDAGGGSTITQQYVRNYYDGLDDRSWQRKAREIILAAKIERRTEKDEILTDYLNTIYFGRQSYGIQAAAQTYFGVDVQDLDQAQAAVLAGILPAPVNLDPAANPEGAQGRFGYVVSGLVETGAVTQADAAALAFPEVQPPEQSTTGPEGFLMQMVRDELRGLGYTDEQIDTGGLSVTTTFSQVEQQKARDAVYAGLAEALEPTGGVFPEGLRAGLAAIDPKTGEVRAVFAGDQFLVGDQVQRNAVTDDRYQAGSTLKPFALVAGLESGIGLEERYDGRSPQTFGNNDEVEFENFGNESFGRINLVTATANSVNTVYAQLNEDLGYKPSYDAMVRAGLPPGCDTEEGQAAAPDCTQDLAPFEIGNILGSAAPHVMDTTQAYATLAAQGVRRDWHVVREVRGPDGVVQRTADTTSTPEFEAGVMADTTYALTQVVEEGSGRRNVGQQITDRPIAGKTGTASNNLGTSFAGYTPQLAAVAALWWDGRTADGAPTAQPVVLPGAESGVTGGSYPAAIFREYILRALEGAPVEDFPEPTGRASVEQAEAEEERARQAEEQRQREEEERLAEEERQREEQERLAEEERQRQEEEERRRREQEATPEPTLEPTTEPTMEPTVEPEPPVDPDSPAPDDPSESQPENVRRVPAPGEEPGAGG